MKLVGTIHFDIDGPRRLEHLLQTFRPRSISVECPASLSSDEIERRINEQQEMAFRVIEGSALNRFQKDLLRALYGGNMFEVWVPLKYAKLNGAEVYFTDHPRVLEWTREEQINQDLGARVAQEPLRG